MGRPRSYNPNTKAGCRNIRQQYYENYEKKTPQQKSEHDSSVFLGRFILFVIVIIACLIIVANGGRIK
jgi:hypothetical protein